MTPRLFIEAMAKHLPPSASILRLADVNGAAGDVLRELRADLDVLPVYGETWNLATDSVDAITAFGHRLAQLPLEEALKALRPGGRLIVVDPDGETHRSPVQALEKAGYTRILVEAAVETAGVLMRGEKPHTTGDTTERVNLVAARDRTATNLSSFKGRYLHLLIRQTPNKPVWALTPDDPLRWEAVAVRQGDVEAVLAFSSLPNAVSLMQAAVLAGTLRDVNKVGKFSRATAERWQFQILLNPTPDFLTESSVVMLSIDPATAETGDE